MTEQGIKELQEKHGKIHVLSVEVDGDHYEVVVKRPSRAEFKRYRGDSMKEGAKRDEVAEEFLLRHIVSERAEWDAIAEDRPGLVETFVVKLLGICGFGAEVEAKKY